MNLTTDEEIVQQVQNGDTQAFGVLVERYAAKILRYARKFLLSREDSEDLVQEVFIKVYINIQSFDARKKFSSWLYRIAHNEFINALKKKKREPLAFVDLDALFPHPFAKETTDQGIRDREITETLDRLLDTLDPKYREPLVLYYFEEMGYQEIAEVLRMPVATVGVRLKRGKDMLKKFVHTI